MQTAAWTLSSIPCCKLLSCCCAPSQHGGNGMAIIRWIQRASLSCPEIEMLHCFLITAVTSQTNDRSSTSSAPWILVLQVKHAMTMTEKILARHSNNQRVAPGENIWTNVDKLMTHDVCGPPTFGIFQREFGMNAEVWDNEKIILIPDHYIFTEDPRANRNVDFLRCGSSPTNFCRLSCLCPWLCHNDIIQPSSGGNSLRNHAAIEGLFSHAPGGLTFCNVTVVLIWAPCLTNMSKFCKGLLVFPSHIIWTAAGAEKWHTDTRSSTFTTFKTEQTSMPTLTTRASAMWHLRKRATQSQVLPPLLPDCIHLQSC